MFVVTSPALEAESLLLEIRSRRCPLPPGTLFTLARHRANDLVLARVNDLFLVGRWLPGVAGCDWLAQPSRLIRCARPPVILGRIVTISLCAP